MRWIINLIRKSRKKNSKYEKFKSKMVLNGLPVLSIEEYSVLRKIAKKFDSEFEFRKGSKIDVIESELKNMKARAEQRNWYIDVDEWSWDDLIYQIDRWQEDWMTSENDLNLIEEEIEMNHRAYRLLMNIREKITSENGTDRI